MKRQRNNLIVLWLVGIVLATIAALVAGCAGSGSVQQGTIPIGVAKADTGWIQIEDSGMRATAEVPATRPGVMEKLVSAIAAIPEGVGQLLGNFPYIQALADTASQISADYADIKKNTDYTRLSYGFNTGNDSIKLVGVEVGRFKAATIEILGTESVYVNEATGEAAVTHGEDSVPPTE